MDFTARQRVTRCNSNKTRIGRPKRGDNDSEYQIYLACADDGKGNEFMTGKPLKTYDEWLAS